MGSYVNFPFLKTPPSHHNCFSVSSRVSESAIFFFCKIKHNSDPDLLQIRIEADLTSHFFFAGNFRRDLSEIRFIALRFRYGMATMESLIGLVNRIQRACTVLGDHGGEGSSLWEALPSVAVVGGQVIDFSWEFPFSSIGYFGILWKLLFMLVSEWYRVRGNRRCWRAL